MVSLIFCVDGGGDPDVGDPTARIGVPPASTPVIGRLDQPAFGPLRKMVTQTTSGARNTNRHAPFSGLDHEFQPNRRRSVTHYSPSGAANLPNVAGSPR